MTMPLLNITNIPERLTSFTAEGLVVRDNCVASKQASKQASIVYNREIVRAKARLVSFAVWEVSCRPMKPVGFFAFLFTLKITMPWQMY